MDHNASAVNRGAPSGWWDGRESGSVELCYACDYVLAELLRLAVATLSFDENLLTSNVCLGSNAAARADHRWIARRN